MTKKKLTYLVLICLVVTAVGLALARATAGGSSASELLGVPGQGPSAAQLAPFGLALTDPHGAVPASPTAAQAAENAVANVSGARALNAIYAHCVDANLTPALDQDCWVVNLNPSDTEYPGSMPGDGTPPPANWYIALVDPDTNKPLEGLSSSH